MCKVEIISVMNIYMIHILNRHNMQFFLPGGYSSGQVAGIVMGTLIGLGMMAALMVFVFLRYYIGAGCIKNKDTKGLTAENPGYSSDAISTA